MYVKIGAYPGMRSKKERVVKIRIDKFDTWNMDHTLALMIVPMIKQLIDTKHGAPNTEDSDLPENLRSINDAPKENTWDTGSLHFDRWNWVLSEILWAFEQMLDEESDSQFHTGEIHHLWQALDKNDNKLGEPKELGDKTKLKGTQYYQMLKGPNDTHVHDAEGHQKHEDRKRNGFRLFGKYYQCLWD